MKRFFISWYQNKNEIPQKLSEQINKWWASVTNPNFVCFCASVDALTLQEAKRLIRNSWTVDGEFRFYQEKNSQWRPKKYESNAIYQTN